MRVLAQIQTAFSGNGSDIDGNRPRFQDNFQWYRWEDKSGIEVVAAYPDPNVYTIEAELEDTSLQAVEDHPDYWVVWAETIPTEADPTPPQEVIAGVPVEGAEPTQQRHDAWAQWLLASQHTQAFVDNTLGPAPAGRTAGEIGQTVYVAERQLPPGVPAPPYALTVRVTREPGWQGALGWRAELVDWEQNVAPAAVAITTWTEPDASGTSIVHGPFNDNAGTWEVVCSSGFEPGNGPIYFSILYGSAVWAAWTIPPGEDGQETVYVVGGDPGATGQQGVWVDSGATVTGAEGTATTVSDTAPFSIGTKTRINGVEQTVNNIGANWINLTPYQNPPHANGSVIEIK